MSKNHIVVVVASLSFDLYARKLFPSLHQHWSKMIFKNVSAMSSRSPERFRVQNVFLGYNSLLGCEPRQGSESELIQIEHIKWRQTMSFWLWHILSILMVQPPTPNQQKSVTKRSWLGGMLFGYFDIIFKSKHVKIRNDLPCSASCNVTKPYEGYHAAFIVSKFRVLRFMANLCYSC